MTLLTLLFKHRCINHLFYDKHNVETYWKEDITVDTVILKGLVTRH